MTPSPSNPKLPNWIFWLTYAVLLLTAWFIGHESGRPLSATAVFSIVACVIVGACIATIPIVYHHERKKNETLDDRQRALEALAHTVSSSAEQISIAAQGLHEIAELAQKNLRMAEQLPAQLQGKIVEFEVLLSGAQTDERDELKKELALLRASESDRLEAIADKVDHASGELTKLEAVAQKHLAAAQAALAKAPEALTTATAAALAQIESKLSAHPFPAAAAPPASPARAPEPASKPIETFTHIAPVVPLTAPPFAGNIISGEPPATSEAVDDTPVPAADEPKPARKRAPKKPRPAEATEAALALDADAPASPIATAAAIDESTQSEPEETTRSSADVLENGISSDGATRMLVTAYIGIGNRLFVRGDGPGLGWDKGVPLHFVSIGKWRWETSEASGPVKFKLYKNDDIECSALGTQTISPGHQLEISATF